MKWTRPIDMECCLSWPCDNKFRMTSLSIEDDQKGLIYRDCESICHLKAFVILADRIINYTAYSISTYAEARDWSTNFRRKIELQEVLWRLSFLLVNSAEFDPQAMRSDFTYLGPWCEKLLQLRSVSQGFPFTENNEQTTPSPFLKRVADRVVGFVFPSTVAFIAGPDWCNKLQGDLIINKETFWIGYVYLEESVQGDFMERMVGWGMEKFAGPFYLPSPLSWP